jgi:hypothetical protein
MHACGAEGVNDDGREEAIGVDGRYEELFSAEFLRIVRLQR